MIDAALLTLRSVSGGLLAGHGAQKLFGAFRGPGLEGVSGMMDRMGLQPPDAWARVASATELAGGSLTALGLLSPLGPITAMGPMTIATTMAHWGRPIWVTEGGAELPVTNLAVFGAAALAGPGRYSLDSLLGIRLPRWMGFACAAGVAGGAVAAHMLRRPQPQAEQPQQAEPESAETQIEEREVELRAGADRRRAGSREAAQAHAEPGSV